MPKKLNKNMHNFSETSKNVRSPQAKKTTIKRFGISIKNFNCKMYDFDKFREEINVCLIPLRKGLKKSRKSNKLLISKQKNTVNFQG